MTTATASTALETGKVIMDTARRVTLKMVEDIPDDKLCHQPSPGVNHALWTLGHLACTDNWFACTLGGRESVIDESWNALFGMGSQPRADAGDYPAPAEIRKGLERARVSLLECFESMDERTLLGPVPDELKGFAPSMAGAMHSIAWHEGFHAGALSPIRRSLGLPSALGM